VDELATKIKNIDHEKQELKSKFEDDVCQYKDKLGQQVTSIQGSMEHNIRQNQDL
jgi:hypothetical protein